MKNVLKCAGRWAGLAALLAGLSLHGLAAILVLGGVVVVLAVLGHGIIRWIIDSDDRYPRQVDHHQRPLGVIAARTQVDRWRVVISVQAGQPAGAAIVLRGLTNAAAVVEAVTDTL